MRPVACLLSMALLAAASPARAVVLDGTVTRSDTAAPVDGAVVLVRGTGLYVQANAAGFYSLPAIPAGVYGLSCSAPGLVGVSTGAVDLSADATRDFDLAPPADTTAAVSGTATCAGTGCAGALLQARQNGQLVASAVSGPGGAYQLNGLSEGATDIRALRLEYALAEQLGVAVSLAAPARVDLDLIPAGRVNLSGRVGLSDNPLDKSGSTIRVYGQTPAVAAGSSAGGTYALPGVPTGLLSIAATHPGYNWHHRLDVLVQSDGNLDFVLTVQGGTTEPTYRVAGLVQLQSTDGSDPGVAEGCRVSVWRTDADLHRTTTTGADGRYAVGGLPAGNYQAAAAREGFHDSIADPFDLSANRSLDFQLEPDPAYDWGPGAGDGELGCGHAGAGPLPGALALGLLGLLAWIRNRSHR